MEEFEIYESGDMLVAIPFDFDGGTQGETLKEATEMAWDWLRTELECRMMDGDAIPDPTIDNEPKHGGRIVLVAINVNLSDIKTVSAATAADMLGVTRGRVSQLFKAGLLYGYKSGRDLMITIDSINARLNSVTA